MKIGAKNLETGAWSALQMILSAAQDISNFEQRSKVRDVRQLCWSGIFHVQFNCVYYCMMFGWLPVSCQSFYACVCLYMYIQYCTISC